MSIKKIFVATFSLIALTTLLSTPVLAAEITPDSSTYSYGSTSEFSPSERVTTGSSSSSEGLAPTGQDKNSPIIIGGVVVILGVGVLVISRRKLKK